MMNVAALASLAAIALAGCAPMISGTMNLSNNEETVNKKATEYFKAAPGQVKVSNIEKHALNTTFRAQYRGKSYNCHVYYGDVTCK
ncbi:MAG: hypothetical protein JST38_20795 [Bacteroidetes bacterium]|nr:hypothetical protein [Bacteroidota bacterium]